MFYVEYLRAKRTLRIAGIILGVALLLDILFRIFFIHGGGPETYAYALQHAPNANVVQQRLPDGSMRIQIDDPTEKMRAVVVRGGQSLRIDVTQPAQSKRERYQDGPAMGQTDIAQSTHAGVTHTRITYRRGASPLPLGFLFLATLPIGLLVATILGGPLSRENDGHLEIAWTKPVSREIYALAAISVDAAAIVISQLLAACAILMGLLLWGTPPLSAGAMDVMPVATALITSISWYAFITAASASLKRGPGLAIGLGWFAAFLIPALLQLTSTLSSGPGVWVYDFFRVLTYLDPIAYLFHGSGVEMPKSPILPSSLSVLIALAIFYIVLSVLQWRRVEA